jgi:hypothetical protein
MTDQPIDLEFRPTSYWATPESRFANVKGRVRREAVKKALEEGHLDELPPEIASDELSRSAVEAAGRIHPSFMGGEYLPKYDEDEIEIARVNLQSVTFDVISIRAWRKEGEIFYRVVDEYDSRFDLFIESSEEPLTLRELIELIDNTDNLDAEDSGGLVWGVLDYHVDNGSDPEEMRTFVDVESPFYPQLARYYSEQIDGWVDRRNDA